LVRTAEGWRFKCRKFHAVIFETDPEGGDFLRTFEKVNLVLHFCCPGLAVMLGPFRQGKADLIFDWAALITKTTVV
jgi:hypothetical protein